MVNSINKGKSGEREAARAIEEVMGFIPGTIRRSQQYSGKGDSSADLIGLPGVHLEIKRTEKFKLYPSLDQAYRDAKNENVPIVIHRQNNKDWVVVVKLKDLPRLSQQISGMKGSGNGKRIQRKPLRDPSQPSH